MIDEELKKMYPDQYEKTPTEILKPQPTTTAQPNLPDFLTYSREYLKAHPESIQYVLGDTLTDLNNWLNDLPIGIGNILKAQIPPEYGWLINTNGNGNSPQLRTGRRSLRIDEDEEGDEEYIPDTDILKEAISEAVTMHLADIPWADISNHLYRKYEIDWHYMKVKDVVLKNLAWGQRRPQKREQFQPTEKPIESKIVQPELKLGLIRRFLKYLW